MCQLANFNIFFLITYFWLKIRANYWKIHFDAFSFNFFKFLFKMMRLLLFLSQFISS